MIEVIPHGNGWRWRMIAACGRALVESFETFPCNISAFDHAKDYRTCFWSGADRVDWRMGRNI